ncbi:MAG TPA: DUF4382 domain-containing protein [Terriglobales bacterium]
MRRDLCGKTRLALALVTATIILMLVACGGNSTNPTNNNTNPQSGTMSVVISDASAEDWSAIDVKVMSIALTPQGGGSPVTVYTAPNPAPMLNLVELDQLGELLGNMSVMPGTYSSATLTLSANPGDVNLVVSPDPETGFPATPGSTIPSNQIQIQNTTGGSGGLTVPLKVNFSSPLTVTGGQNSAINLEFNLAHPAFLVAHVPLGGGSTIWAVNFNPAFRHHPIDDITRLVLRHMYGTVQSVSTDNTSFTMMRDFPVEPASNPESEITSSQSINILADSVNGTIFYDLDAKTSSVIQNFSAQASTLGGKFVRVAARFQQDGTLVAVRVWASTSFSKVWLNPEGHVLHVNTTTDIITVSSEDGTAFPVTINGNTQFFFRTPYKAQADATPIGTGTAFLSNIVRGFKVHVSVVDALANPVVAQSVDIENAVFSGTISSPTGSAFTYTRNFHTASDDYTINLDYVSSSTANGKDGNGNPITGFKWWNFAFPTTADTGTNAITDFVNATSGTANFGGTAGPVNAFGESYTVWDDPANPSNAWSALWSILDPTPLPLATVSANWVTNPNGGTFGITVPNGTTAVTISASSVSGSATLFYQVDRTNGVVTVTPQDVTSSAGLTAISTNLASPTLVKVYGVPQSDGSIKAYVVFYFTGATKPLS